MKNQKWSSRLLSAVLILSLVLAMLAAMPMQAAAATPKPYNGTAVTPIQISQSTYKTLGLTDDNWSQWNGYYAIRNASELYGWAKLANVKNGSASAVLLQDIVVNETVSASGATYSWTPICEDYAQVTAYVGSFDGNGHFISGLYADTSKAGFIGNMRRGTIKNLIIKNSYFNGSARAGAIVVIACDNDVKINNCRVDSDVTVSCSNVNVGGICGGSYACISNCVSFATVRGSLYCVGGIMGTDNSSENTISNNYYLTGSVTDGAGTVQNGIGITSTGETLADVAGECTALASASDSHTCVSVTHQQVNASCEYPGLSEYSYCLICGKITSGTKTETTALGHSWQAATCVVAKTCSLCGITEGSLGNHSYSYSASGNVITESCSYGCGHSVQLTLNGCDPVIYTGSAQTPLTISYPDGWVGSTALTVSYSNNINVGTATGTVSIGDATAAQTFAISAADIGTAVISGIAEMTYTGAGQTQKPTVTWNGAALTEGTDYMISGNTAADAGSYTLTVEGKGNFTGKTTAEYTVSAADIGTAVISGIVDMTYTGGAQTQNITVTWNSATLTEGKDYSVSGNTATNAGSYRIVITGDGNFTGSASTDWSIGKLDVSETANVGEFDPLTYNRNAQTPYAAVTVKTEKGTETVAGSWTDVTNVSDTSRFIVAASGNFTGTLAARSVGMLPMDIGGTELILEAEGVYDGYIQEPAVVCDSVTLGSGDYTVTWDTDPVIVGSYTATIYGEGNYTGSVERPFSVTQKTLTISGIEARSKSYDATDTIDVYTVNLDGFVFYSEGSYVSDILDYDDVYDDVSVDLDKLVITISGNTPGIYTEADLSNIVLTGETAGNYTIAASVENAALVDYEIYTSSLWITAENQYIEEGEELDQTLYSVEDLDEKFTLSGIALVDNGYGRVEVDTSGAVITFNGEDVTEYFELNTMSGVLEVVCEGHSFDDNGFCSTGNCQVYQAAKAVQITDEYGSVEIWYEISNAGQLYWFAQQVNEYGDAGICGRVTKDIVVNKDLTAENLRQWIPIGGGWTPFTGNFDGQDNTISGLYFNNENASRVGLFGYTDYGYTIKNVHISNSYFCGNAYVAGLIGYAGSVVSGCSADSTVTVIGKSYLGGLIGDSGDGELTNCWSTASVPGLEGYVGGLIGQNCMVVTNCYTTDSRLAGYTNENYGGNVTNSYYLSEELTADGGMTEAEFASGEVAYLLQSGIAGEDIYDEDWNWIGTAEPEQVWGQSIGEDAYPVLGGAKVYQVENCKAEVVYSNIDENIGHSYENGSCTVCGSADPAYVAPSITQKGRNLEYKDMIYVLDIFELKGIDLTQVDLSKDAGILVWSLEEYAALNGNIVFDEAHANPGLLPYQSTAYYYGKSDGIFTRDLYKQAYYAGYVKLPDGTYIYSEAKLYGPTAYAYKMLVNGNDKTKTLCVALLNYISAAQKYFDSTTPDEALANKDLTDEQKALSWDVTDLNLAPAVPADKDVTRDKTVFAGRGKNLLFEEMISLISVYLIDTSVVNSAQECGTIFWTAEQFEALTEAPSVDNFGEGTKVTGFNVYQSTDGQWYSAAPAVAPKDMADSEYYILGYVIHADGSVSYSGVMAYTFEQYIANMADNASMGEFAKRLYFYERAAKDALG